MALTPEQIAQIQAMAKNLPARPAPSPMADPAALMALRQKLAPPVQAPKQGIDPTSLMALKAKMEANTPQVQPSKSSIPGGQVSRWSAGGVVQRMDNGGPVLTPQQMSQIASLGMPATSSIPLPNGGLTGQDLQNYIAANPGPQAIVGNNPANPGQVPAEPAPLENEAEKEALAEEQAPKDAEESDEDKEEEAPTKKAVVKEEDIPSPSEDEKSGSQPSDFLGDLLSKLRVDPDRLKAAQDQQSDMMRNNALAMGGKEIAAALSRGGYKPNFEANQQLNAMAQLPVQQQMQQQKIIQDAIQSGAQLSDLEDKSKLQDPKSPVSQAYRQTAMTLLPSIANSPGFQNMSAEGIKQMLPMADMSIRSAANQEIAKDRLMNQQMMMQQRADQRQDQQQQHATEKQNQTYNQTIQQLEQMRGSPAVSQAEKDLYAAQKAQTLIDQAPGGDLNKLSPTQVSLYTREVAKIAQGGTSTQEELAGLTPNTLATKFASTAQKLINEPTSDNAGAFLKQYVDYTKGLGKDAQNTIQDRYGRIINSRKNQLSEDQTQSLNDNYLSRFKTSSAPTSSAPVKMMDPQGKIRMIPGDADTIAQATAAGGKIVQ